MTSPADPDLSIVVPVYNGERWLDRCLESLSRQTLKTREIIVVDDGSTDDTSAIIERWSRLDPTIRALRKNNGGCASARSAGLHSARGKFVGFVDADDWVDAGMFARLLSLANQYDAEIAQAGFYKVFLPHMEKEKHEEALGEGVRYFDKIDDETRYRLLMGKPSIWRRIYSRDYLRKNNIDFPVEIRNYDDLTFQFEAMITVERFVATDEALYFYLLGHPDQTVEFRDERHFVHFALFDYLRERRNPAGDPNIWKCFKRVQLNSHLWSHSLLREEYRERHSRLAAHDIFEVGNALDSVRILIDLIAHAREQKLGTRWMLKYWWLYVTGRALDPHRAAA